MVGTSASTPGSGARVMPPIASSFSVLMIAASGVSGTTLPVYPVRHRVE
jgi:hypothetical protein